MSEVDPKARVAGTRGSRLALWQAGFVTDLLRERFPKIGWERRIISTHGDDSGERLLADFGGAGIFTSELEKALIAGTIDCAVHSLKDLPVEPDGDTVIAAVLGRTTPHDAVVSRGRKRLADLPAGAVIGTSSIRRRAQILAVRPDCVVRPIRGNVETRIAQVRRGEYDAIVIAAAGIERLGLGDEIAERLAFDVMMPSPGQGAIAVQCRRDDATMNAYLSAVDDRALRACVAAERELLRCLGGGCSAPVSAIATIVDDFSGDESTTVTGTRASGALSPTGAPRVTPMAPTIELRGRVSRPDGSFCIDLSLRGTDPLLLAGELSKQALAEGAGGILATAGKRVVVTRASDRAAELIAELERRGFRALPIPVIRIDALGAADIQRALAGIAAWDWVVFCSVSAIAPFFSAVETPGVRHRFRIGAVGPGTAAALRSHGWSVEYVPEEHSALALGRGLPIAEGERILVPQGDRSGSDCADALAARGGLPTAIACYRTVVLPFSEEDRIAIRSGIDAVIFTSGSTVEAFLADLADGAMRSEAEALLHGTAAICIGPKTAEAARSAGFTLVSVAAEPTTHGIASALEAALEAAFVRTQRATRP